MRSVVIILMLVSVFLTVGRASALELTVAAAANLEPLLSPLAESFYETTRVSVKFVTGSSGKLVTQIDNGAPFDVFLSADMNYPEVLFKEGWAVEPPRTYAKGLLVLWTIKDLDLSRGVDVLKDPSVRTIAIASPQSAPYGREAVKVFEHFAIYKDLETKFVYGENLAQANTFVMTGAADAGVTSKSTVMSGKAASMARWVDIPRDSYSPVLQGVVVLKRTQGEVRAAAQAFVDFLFSEKAKTIFEQGGYLIP